MLSDDEEKGKHVHEINVIILPRFVKSKVLTKKWLTNQCTLKKFSV